MAAIQDTANVLTGVVLDAFNEMERVVARDGDTVGAGETLRQTFIRICHTRQTTTAGTSGTTTVKRS
jgi:hypothetical protein